MLNFGRLLKARSGNPSTAEGERIYAIGDIHGRLDLMKDILARIERHAATLPPARSVHIVVLGDMIDRGPDSAAVLRYLHGVQQTTGRLIVLHGNHEELMLRALAGEPGMLRAWMRIGGSATIRSYGVEPPHRDDDQRAAVNDLLKVIPSNIIEWIRHLPLTARSGDYLFCHAGIRPGVALKRQKRADLVWIRDEFLEDPLDHGVMVVHGHSVSTDVEMRGNRIGIDTGAYRTGILTALYLEGEDRQIISTEAPLELGSADAVDATPVEGQLS
ncbi:metallophosphoesterase [Sphingobium sp. BS19]|nr:metallophosphoesterase [Sphingobium sp. BS19]